MDPLSCLPPREHLAPYRLLWLLPRTGGIHQNGESQRGENHLSSEECTEPHDGEEPIPGHLQMQRKSLVQRPKQMEVGNRHNSHLAIGLPKRGNPLGGWEAIGKHP